MTDPRVAWPDDDDLDIDVDCVTLTAITVDGRHVRLHAEGGFGFWVDPNGERAVFAPGDDGVEQLDFALWFPAGSDREFHRFLARLKAWRAEATPLRFCGAPGRLSALLEDNDCWVPIPRATPTPN